jgi:hypothetical protein
VPAQIAHTIFPDIATLITTAKSKLPWTPFDIQKQIDETTTTEKSTETSHGTKRSKRNHSAITQSYVKAAKQRHHIPSAIKSIISNQLPDATVASTLTTRSSPLNFHPPCTDCNDEPSLELRIISGLQKDIKMLTSTITRIETRVTSNQESNNHAIDQIKISNTENLEK